MFRAKCIKCIFCTVFFSPNKFVFHSHRYNHKPVHQFTNPSSQSSKLKTVSIVMKPRIGNSISRMDQTFLWMPIFFATKYYFMWFLYIFWFVFWFLNFKSMKMHRHNALLNFRLRNSDVLMFERSAILNSVKKVWIQLSLKFYPFRVTLYLMRH